VPHVTLCIDTTYLHIKDMVLQINDLQGDVMHRGILSQELTTQPPLSLQDDIAGELAYDEAMQLATESERLLCDVEQAEVVKDILAAKQIELASGGCSPTLALECMNMSLVILGGRPEPVLSTESDLGTLATEGVGSVVNKIIETTKLILKRVVNSLKVIMTKLMVAMNRTGKKAEALYKSFNADKQAYPRQGKIDEDKAEKIVRMSRGLQFIKDNKYSQSMFETNIQAGFKYSDGLGVEMDAFHKKTGGSTIPEKLMEVFKSISFHSAKLAIAKAVSNDPSALKAGPSFLARFLPGKPYQLSKAQHESANLPGGGDSGYIFLPAYVKGNLVYGTVVYVADPEPDPTDVYALIDSVSFGLGSFEYESDDKITELAAKERVMDKGSINAELSSLKSASTRLKTLSTSRMNSITKIMSDISKMSSKDGGNMKLSKVATRDITKRKMFAVSVAISSITAYATLNKNRLSRVAAHISLYE